jgi:2-oxoglutarate ferredoxin oxidoreductase subunit gamma
MKDCNFKIVGFGGQGIILTSYVLGTAISIHDGNSVSMTQSYGPEARGGTCSSQLVISSSEVNYPLVEKTDILVVLSQEGYDKYFQILNTDGVLFYDLNMVKKEKINKKIKAFSIPATKIAEDLGNKLFANMVMLGFIAAHTDIVKAGSLKKAIKETVSPKYIDIDLKAFDLGYHYAENANKE